MLIRKTTESDKKNIEKIHLAAFGKEKGPVIAKLTLDLLDDKTALPILSLAAVNNNQLIGHILFTRVSIIETSQKISAQILAPLAVLPEAQNTGIGQKLIREGLKQLKESGVDLVFVLGHPGYYPRCGFKNDAEALGFKAPYSIPDEHADAWMVQELNGKWIGKIQGTVQCSEVLNQPEHWRE